MVGWKTGPLQHVAWQQTGLPTNPASAREGFWYFPNLEPASSLRSGSPRSSFSSAFSSSRLDPPAYTGWKAKSPRLSPDCHPSDASPPPTGCAFPSTCPCAMPPISPTSSTSFTTRPALPTATTSPRRSSTPALAPPRRTTRPSRPGPAARASTSPPATPTACSSR